MNLDTIPLFSTLGNTDLAALAASTRTVDLPPGRILCNEDEAGNSMFVVLEGRLEVIKAFRTADHRLLAVLAPGEFVGELSLIMKKNRRTATVRAQGNARILELSTKQATPVRTFQVEVESVRRASCPQVFHRRYRHRRRC